MSIETLINDVQEARDNLGMKRLANPKKMGAGKLKDMLQDLNMKLALEKQAAPAVQEAPEAPETKTWEQKWEDAIDQEEKLATAAAIQQLPEEKVVVKEPKVKKERSETVKDYACALLCEVVGQQDGRDVGMPYETVLEHIKVKFPDAKTSVNCLRWYAGKIRIEAHGYVGLKMPAIRQRTKKAEKVQPVAQEGQE
ncbi:hypothetical protein AMA1_59 [Achromobacter phage AMA1]|nr:hypothetical protein AMA1_59 [Achromobacter phage AMA1]